MHTRVPSHDNMNSVLYIWNACIDSSFFHRYTPELRARMAKYACQHGTQAASDFFSRRLGRKVSQSSIHSIKLAYVKTIKENEGHSSDEDT